jgi:signal transduction histidine kinase
MHNLKRLFQEIRLILFIMLLLNNILLFFAWYLLQQVGQLSFQTVLILLFVVSVLIMLGLAALIGAYFIQPVKLLWSTILGVSPRDGGEFEIKAPSSIWLGKDVVEAMGRQVHQLVRDAKGEGTIAPEVADLQQNIIANSLPLPLIVLDKESTVVFANTPAMEYLGVTQDIINQNVNKLHMVFSQAEEDFNSWVAGVQKSAKPQTRTWEGVRVERGEDVEPRLFDLAAYYREDNPDKCETVVVLMDHSARYAQESQEVGFIALAVHELRTPLTVLRGYIEALDEELSGELQGETRAYFNKMKASAQQLTTFINNILNVARIEGNQLEVMLREENWDSIVKAAVANLELRAQVRDITLECEIGEGLPPVGVDRFTITEVITNIVDNAIKYSAGKGHRIVIRTELTKDNLVELTVRDYGVGISENVLPTLFNKFQRNFHNRASIRGTGLGLFLSKVIVTAHGGNIWVSSKEGKGTTVGFTVQPFANLSDEQKSGHNPAITQDTHGWIKNHNLSRR